MSSSSSDENKKLKSMIGDDDETKATREKLMLDFHKDVEASFGDKLRSVTYWGSLQMRRVADDKACRCRQLVTSRVGLSPILGNPGSQITGSAETLVVKVAFGNLSVQGSKKLMAGMLQQGYSILMQQVQPETLAVAVALEETKALEVVAVARLLNFFIEALCKVRGEIDVEFRDEANAADPYKVVVLVG
nr:hypothetical protein [Tanacetum cinerariifolium]